MSDFKLYTISAVCLVASAVFLCYGRFWPTVAMMIATFAAQSLAKREG